MPFVKGIGVPELLIVMVIIMIIFGVGRLPEIGGYLGKGIREFRRVQTSDDPVTPVPAEPDEQKTEVPQETKA
jgi:sec-independent protein translocase protein TatA